MAQASFGATPATIDELESKGYEAWLREQFETSLGVSALTRLNRHLDAGGSRFHSLPDFFWENALHADDQLRWRVTFALSQIIVVSLAEPMVVTQPKPYAQYIDILRKGALTNYCDVVREVTYSPAMALYLTYYGNRKRDEVEGFVPDENYAREVLQLFTIGLEELNIDGTSKGTETYGHDDIAGLASVMTGLSAPGTPFGRPPDDDSGIYPLKGYRDFHEGRSKTFLGHTINYGANPEQSIEAALDFILAHPNVAPFVAKQLIQKLVTSNPSPDYVRRVAEAFNAGLYGMGDGTVVGEGRRCDMQATIAAVLLDEEARTAEAWQRPDFGKVRATVLRTAHILRVLGEEKEVSAYGEIPSADGLNYPNPENAQPVFYSPSVFNFYRPGFTPAGTDLARDGLVAPEMQILDINDVIQSPYWANYADPTHPTFPVFDLKVDELKQMAMEPEVLIDHLDLLLTAGQLSDETRALMIEALNEIPVEGRPTDDLFDEPVERVKLAVQLFLSSPEYMVQR